MIGCCFVRCFHSFVFMYMYIYTSEILLLGFCIVLCFYIKNKYILKNFVYFRVIFVPLFFKRTSKPLLSKFSRHFEIFFVFFPENRLRHFMQIGDSLHEISKPVS